jgi:ribonuclease HI
LDSVLRRFWGTFGAVGAAVLVAPSKVRTCYAVKLDFSCINNIAKYKALLLGLQKLKAMGIRRAVLKTDSQVISGHVDKSCKARDPKLEKYLDTVRRLEASFEGFSVKNIPRGENEHADLLAKSVAQGLPLPSEVFFETIKAPLVELLERAVLNISPIYSEDWRTEIMSFLQGNFLSDDEAYNKRIEARARPYVIIEGELYKHGVCSPLLKCLSRAEGIELMKEIHAGLCGSHCDTQGVSFGLCREIYPNLGRSVKNSISRPRLYPFIKLLVKVSPISDFVRISRTTKFGAY